MEIPPEHNILSVNLDHAIQTEYLGVNATYHGFAFMPEQIGKGMDDTDREREFERLSQLGLNIARTWYRPDWACGETLSDVYDWDSTKMYAFYRWLTALKDRGIDVAIQAGWWFTRDTYYGHPQPDPVLDVELYSHWVSESLHQMIVRRGFDNIRYLVLFTEPTTYESGLLPEGETQWSYYVKMVTALHQRLIVDGRRHLVKLVGPNNSTRGIHLVEAVRELDDVLDIYSGHDYNQADYTEWLQLCQDMQSIVSSTGKPFWLDEYGLQDEPARIQPQYGNYLAQAVAAALNAGCQSSFLWLLFDQQYVSTDISDLQEVTNADSFYSGVHRWGTWKWPHDTLPDPQEPYPHWYAFSLLSKYIGGRQDTRVQQTQSSSAVVIAATRPNGVEHSFLLVNLTDQDQPVQVHLSRPINRTLYRYMYLPADIQVTPAGQMIGYSRVQENVREHFRDVLPPRAIAIYTSLLGQPGLLPQAPVWVLARRTGRGPALITWLDRSKNESGYHIERWNQETGETQAFRVSAKVKEFMDDSVQPGIAYTYRVCAFNNDGRSEWVYTDLK
jgi:hypothetical protein